MGVDNRKTYEMDIYKVASFVPPKQERHFLRGMMDGDGGFCLYKYPYFKKHSAVMVFTGKRSTCEYMRDRFGLSTKLKHETGDFYTMKSSCRKDIVRIGHYLYDDATIYLDRKMNKVLEICEIYKQEK